MPQQQRGLRRSIRPVTRSFKVSEKVDGPLNTNVSEDHDTNVETPNFQAIRVQKPKLKTDFRKQLDHLQRASTPSTLIEDFRYRQMLQTCIQLYFCAKKGFFNEKIFSFLKGYRKSNQRCGTRYYF